MQGRESHETYFMNAAVPFPIQHVVEATLLGEVLGNKKMFPEIEELFKQLTKKIPAMVRTKLKRRKEVDL